MVKKLLTFALILIISVSAIFTVWADDNKAFILTDYVSDTTYEIVYNNGYIDVKLNGNIIGTTYIKDILTCSIIGDVITFYTVDSLNKSFTVYHFKFYNDEIDSYAINADAFMNEHCFATDSNGTVYYVSGNDSKILCGFKNDIDLNAQIKQILCIDGESLIAVTTTCTYICKNSKAQKALDYPLSTPARYIGENTLKDTSDKTFTFENSSLYENIESTTDAIINDTSINKLESSLYFTEPDTTVSKIKKAFANFEITKVTKADGKVIESGKVGTGTTLTFSTGETVKIIIPGELTGEGNINSRDIKAVLDHLSSKELLSENFLLAADIDQDTVITTKDAYKIALMY